VRWFTAVCVNPGRIKAAFRRWHAWRYIAVLSLLTVGGCPTPECTPTAPCPPSTLRISPQAPGDLRVGETLLLSARVTDRDANVISGASVTWRSDDPSVASVDQGGLVSAHAPGTARVAAQVSMISAAVDVRVLEGGHLSVVSGDAQSGVVAEPLSDSVTVRLSDSGQPVEGVAVVWSVEAGGGSVSPPSTQTDAQGLARTEWTMGTEAGRGTLIVRAPNVSELRLSADAEPGPPVSLGLEPGLAVLAVGGEEQVQASLEDRFGNTVDPTTAEPVSRNPDVVTASSGGTLSAWTPGTSFVVFKAGEMIDSVAVAVVDGGGFAALVQPEPDDWAAEVSPSDVIDLQVFLIAPAGGTRNLAALQGTLTWDAARFVYQSSQDRNGGPAWVSNHDDAEPGSLRFVAYAAEGSETTFSAGTVRLQVTETEARTMVPLEIGLEAAGTEAGERITEGIAILPSILEVVP
jgi:hypothetical protein